MGGTGVVTQRCVDRSAESAPGESTGRDSSPVSVTIVAPCAMDGDSWRVPTDPSAGDEHNSGSVRPLEVSAGKERGPTDQRLSSGRVIAPRSHDRPQDMQTSDLETEGASHNGSEYRPKTSAVSHDCANDRLIRVVWENRAQRRQQDSAADGCGTMRTDRLSNTAPKQGHVVHDDKLKQLRLAAAATGSASEVGVLLKRRSL
jgi:hypothetical protein